MCGFIRAPAGCVPAAVGGPNYGLTTVVNPAKCSATAPTRGTMPLMTRPSSSGAATGPVRRPRLHRRLVAWRLQLMAGRIGDFAADHWLRSLEWRLAAYLGVMVAFVPIVILEGESHPLPGGT